MKKYVNLILLSLSAMVLFSACAKQPDVKEGDKESGFNTSKDITVVSREDGSGTRGAFIELLGIEEKSADGNKVDKTTTEALIANKTDVMINQVAQNNYAIGYISLGSMTDKVKAIDVDGIKATTENIKNKTYKVSRPFNIATKGEPTGVAKDFIDYILSADGQNVVSKGYIKISDAAKPYTGSKPSGKITVAGSSSVTPIMEKLKEAYVAINPNANIEIQQSDSTSGMKAAVDGTCQIGMASRDLKDSEKAVLKSLPIALDGIAVIVNKNNTAENLSSEEIAKIYKGEVAKWSEIIKY